MQDNYYQELTKVRMERAEELINEADRLLSENSYKSANNRAYYAIEKAINAALLQKHIETKTHNGALAMFNINLVRAQEHYFSSDDYRMIARAEQIRSVSDYDDFYIANKEETVKQVTDAKYIVEKVKKYLEETKA